MEEREWTEKGVTWIREGTYDTTAEAKAVVRERKAEGYGAYSIKVPDDYRTDSYWTNAKTYVVYRTKEPEKSTGQVLLIDGVKYKLWTPQSEDEFEQVVKKHTQEIFGEQSIYFDRKQKLKSLSGIGSIPDGYTTVLGDSPQWHVVEMELSAHLPHDHVVTQLNRFTLGIRNPSTQNNLVKAIYDYISGDDFLALRLKKETTCTDIHNFLADLISKQPVLTVIIEKKTEELGEALSIFRREYQIEIVEFQTFVREGVGLPVHAHLFEPIYETTKEKQKQVMRVEIEGKELSKKVTASDFAYKSNGVFAMKADPSITIDVKKRAKIVSERLEQQGLWTKWSYSFYYSLRKKAGLLNTPTEE